MQNVTGRGVLSSSSSGFSSRRTFSTSRRGHFWEPLFVPPIQPPNPATKSRNPSRKSVQGLKVTVGLPYSPIFHTSSFPSAPRLRR